MRDDHGNGPRVPWFGARKMARELIGQLQQARRDHDHIRGHLESLGALTIVELEAKRSELEQKVMSISTQIDRDRLAAEAERQALQNQLEGIRRNIVTTEDVALLQEAGIYRYRHPLTDIVQYESRLSEIDEKIKAMTKKDGGAIHCAQSWTVNGSESQGRAMVRDLSKLMLRAFNAEADNLVRGLKPHKLEAAIDRLSKVAETIERLGKIMQIRISRSYCQLRIRELELTADFIQKQAEDKEAERVERERLREERKVQQEIDRERARLDKERKHYMNALKALIEKGDVAGAERLRAELKEVDKAIEDVDYRAANIRAGYVYVISNIGSFGDSIVKVGMTRRLDPMDRIRELSDASVPFNFDIHALFFSKDAVGIESAMHSQLAKVRVNIVNHRREFFRATPLEVKGHLAKLTGELLQFQDVPEALEFRQCMTSHAPTA